MKELKIDLKILKENLLSLEEFFILDCLFSTEITLIKEYSLWSKINLSSVYKSLYDKKFLLSDPKLVDLSNINTAVLDKIKMKALLGLKVEESLFFKFFSTYPQKVPADRGTSRPLRPANFDTIEGKKLKEKFFKHVGTNLKKQEHVINVLEAELAMRRQGELLKFLPAMEVWLNQHKWESYEYLLEEQSQPKEIGYGENIV